MTITIRENGYYRLLGGNVVGPATWHKDHCCYVLNDNYYKADGSRHWGGEEPTFVAEEVTVSPVLNFPLVAGESYETVKPDGTPGPVAHLSSSGFTSNGLIAWAPLQFNIAGHFWYVNQFGEAMECKGPGLLRITRPYVAPKPPTIAERLRIALDTKFGDIDALLAEVATLEAKVAK